MALLYLFIISSLDRPIFRKIQIKRRKLLDKYNIPYSVLLNANDSHKDVHIPTLIPLEYDEILYPISGYNPHMSQKFLQSVKLFFRTFSSVDEIPDFIVRINATIYVHFPELLQLLEKLPRKRVLAGYRQQWPWHQEPIKWPRNRKEGINGMIMIFSKDVLINMLKDPKIFEKQYMELPDDVALSIIAAPYCKWYDIIDNLYFPDERTDSNGKFLLDKIKPVENNIWLYRIRNENHILRHGDLENWDQIMEYYGEDLTTTTTATPNIPPSSNFTIFTFIHYFSILLCIVLLCLVCFTFIRSI